MGRKVKLVPKPEEEGATSAAMSQLVPQRRFDLPPLSDDRSVDTLLRSRPRLGLGPAYRIPLSAPWLGLPL